MSFGFLYGSLTKIMNPEVPIALRMSGHLLFGVVRIYSKKVEYLQHDCNSLRIEISKAYANADINLPEDANQAKYESITLPDNFALDLMGIDDHDLNGYTYFTLFHSNLDPFILMI
ncbi:putative rad21/Rec8-like protein [Helianthus annuus]|nr:putative rad21/Rec8-like protein [Helianthus annuus]